MPGAGLDLHPSLALQLPHDVGATSLTIEIDGALAQLEAAHRVVGNHLQHHAVVPRRARRSSRSNAVSTTRSSGMNSASRYGPVPIGVRAFAAPEPACTMPITRLIGNDAERALELELDRVADRRR